ASPSIKGAPTYSNGLVVPRPADRLVPLKRQVPGYRSIMSIPVTLGDGAHHDRYVSSKNICRDQPSIGTTVKSQSILNTYLNNKAISPIVKPCRFGIGKRPMKDVKPGSIRLPSTSLPPIGFGRSKTTSDFPCSRQASMI